MFTLKTTAPPPRGAFLVGSYRDPKQKETAEGLLAELRELTGTLGIEVRDSALVRLVRPQARLFLGTGKAQELVDRAKAMDAGVIIFDDPLSPAQQRNWEKLSGLAVIDRQEVILDIFARRARTHEARLQVELARMEYSLPRLTRAWGHLSRQGGSGFGAMGAGETQLETDRRLVRRRIDQLKKELLEVESRRSTRRKKRQKEEVSHAAIVGYTNAGKSSLFEKLSGEKVLVEDKLFATLDTTTRRIMLDGKQPLLLTDTVGFIRRLPHQLVESFKATLEEAVMADFLIHVLDVSNPDLKVLYDTTLNVLEDLGADTRKSLVVLNKVDLLADPARLASLQRMFPEAMLVSAHTGEGLEGLKARLEDFLGGHGELQKLLIPMNRQDLVSRLHREGNVLSKKYQQELVEMTVRLSPKSLSVFEAYLAKPVRR